LKPFADVAFDQKRRRDSQQGEGGEGSAALAFWVWLPRNWVVINDLVLEPEPDEFIQVDHVIIGVAPLWWTVKD